MNRSTTSPGGCTSKVSGILHQHSHYPAFTSHRFGVIGCDDAYEGRMLGGGWRSPS
ncbi:hypothetical protein PHYBLDRAFT_152218 [Phycomyces blakesleeanus NRRL 1555(-)]|uniref:Uncharacterized protein n=1 Tax=Phycomyces blakesleeanus (strain ATCC 8743b / DSM 1359 / FGSC 10004 / NBRC 33097 / NRRL 1555) TaxID=763407 RepID=A0A162T723_PHYB8|nr:hypothetical protein PHYBLDRAFT_152218 [Phycomyces blakesleeanus NRRL 1555(-)]OAD66672.1 hypothetical protein PHYBLDRAFT_152218 [Phycomyces blakesleeanus NRRL 1555(-)]|eukprot:XP_018284712.1 hypothetical protein PHYBLDRAFT_152218 [Phycomyces blakesleeanus NRRL 1555(-)]